MVGEPSDFARVSGPTFEPVQEVQVEAFLGLPDACAVLDGDGQVLVVNRAWAGQSTDPLPVRAVTPGENYLRTCETASLSGELSAERIRVALVRVIAGLAEMTTVDYRWSGDQGEIWMRADVVRLEPVHGSRPRLLVRHVNITEWVQAREDLRTQARTDPLTGLVNRRALATRLAEALSEDEQMVPTLLMLVDVDHFKSINDRYGHLTGDACLVSVADWLRTHTRPEDLVCRWGGDEFVILVQAPTRRQLAAAGRRLAALRGGPSGNVPLQLSWGVAQASRGDTPDSLIGRADHELRLAKAQRDERDREQAGDPRRLAVIPLPGRYPGAALPDEPNSPVPAPRLHSSGDRASVS